jgi:DNA-binding NarL/FixJ family response regulator
MQTIYLIESSPQVCERLLDELGDMPHVCIVGHAETVNAALTDLATDLPDIVLLDSKLERDDDGFDVLREIRGRSPQTAFYVLSDAPSDACRELARQLGALGVLDKETGLWHLRGLIAERATRRVGRFLQH